MKRLTILRRFIFTFTCLLLASAATRLPAQCIAGDVPALPMLYTGIDKLAPDSVYAQQVTVTEGGTLSAIGGVAGLANGSHIKMALYSNNAGAPGNLIVGADTGILITKGIFYQPVTPTCISAGTYWVAWVSDATARLASTDGGAGNMVYTSPSAYSAAFPASFGTAASAVGKKYYTMLSIWCQTSPPVLKLAASKTEACSGDVITLSDTSNSAASLEWFSGGCGGASVGTGYSIQVSPTSTTTYYARASGCGLADVCTSITVTINPPDKIWYRDADGDGDGDAGNTFTGCTPPPGYVAGSCDPDDSNPLFACREGFAPYGCDLLIHNYGILNNAACTLANGMTTINLTATADLNLTWNIVGPDGSSSWQGNGCNGFYSCSVNETIVAEPGSQLHIAMSTPCYYIGQTDIGFTSGKTFTAWLPSCETTVHNGGFACGIYKINRPHDRFTELFINGKLIWRDSIPGSERASWFGELDANSEIVFRSFNPQNPLNNIHNSAILDATLLPPDFLTIQSSATRVCAGQLATLSTNIEGENPLPFVWSNGGSGKTIDVPPGSYSVSISGTCSQLLSNTVVIDTIRPVIPACPGNIVVSKNPGSCGAVVNFNTPYAYVPCMGSKIVDSFGFVNAYQAWTVPANVFFIEIEAAGSKAGLGVVGNTFYGQGAVVKTMLAVVPGETLYLNVGGQPYNGGGLAPSPGNGGGLTSVGRTGNRLTDTLVVAGGAGGYGDAILNDLGNVTGYVPGDNGGGANDGLGLTQLPGLANRFMQGGLGDFNSLRGGGGGGGGYFGGLGGEDGWGGGGGSSYVTPVGTSNTIYQAGGNSGLGYLKISYYVQEPMVQTAGLPSGSEFPVGTTRIVFAPAQTTGAKDSCSFTVTVTGSVCINTWNGNGDWTTAANWSAGHEPTNMEDVLINTGAPILNKLFELPAAQNFSINNGAGFVIGAAGIFTVNGTANFNGQAVTIKSDATGTGAIGSITGSLSGASNVTVERYIPNSGRKWRLLSIPVASVSPRQAFADGKAPNGSAPAGETGGYGTLITGPYANSAATATGNGFDWWAALNNPAATASIRQYTNTGATGNYNTVPNVNAPAGEQGYLLFVRGDRTVVNGSSATTLRATGQLKTGAQTVAVDVTKSHTVAGNPYAAPIDFQLVYNSNSSLIKEQCWIWDATLGGVGGYRLVKKTGGNWYGIPFNYTGTGTQDNYNRIQSGQAFFVEPAPLASSGNMNIAESHKSIGSAPNVFDAPTGTGFLFANLNQDNGSSQVLTDGAAATFGSGYQQATTDLDDVRKVSNFGENFGIVRDAVQLSLEARPQISDKDTVFFSMSGTTVRNYNLQFKAVNLQAGLTARLEDKFTGKSETIGTNDGDITTYAFSVTSVAGSAAADRFRIVFKADQTLPLTLNSARAYQQGSSAVQVDWKATNERNLRSYEVEKSLDGRSFTKASTVAAKNSSEASYSWLDATAVKGLNYYRIKAISNDGTSSYSQVLLVNINNGKSLFSIYPNPAKAGKLSIQFSNMDRGQYELQLFNSVGQKILSRSIEHMGGSSSEELNLGSATAAGVYRVYLLGPNGVIRLQTLVIR